MSQYTEEKKADILALWKNAYIIPCKEAAAKKNCLAFIENKKRYMAASAATNVPWYVIACIHQMESDCNWDRHMHNGDPLKARTVQVPAGRPVAGNPPFTWEESCIDALNYDKLSENKDWSIVKILYLFEKYNGFGYESHNVPSPYVWAGTSVQKPGKYIADHVWDATAVSNRCGCVTMLKTLINIGEISADLSTSSNDTSPLPPTTIPKNEREIIEWRINVADFFDARGFDANDKCVCYLDTNGSIEMFYRSSLAAGAPRARVIFCELPAKGSTIPNRTILDPNLELIKEAVSWVGVHESGGNNKGKEVEEFQKAVDGKASGEPWCMAFVQYCIERIEDKYKVKSSIKRSEHCLTTWRDSPESLKLKGPRPGCVVIWQHGTTANGHTGIVTGLDEKGNLKTVEGNTDAQDGVNRDGNGVFARIRGIKGDGEMKVIGFLKAF